MVQNNIVFLSEMFRSTATVSQHCMCEQIIVDFRAAMLKLFLKKKMYFWLQSWL